MASEPALLRPAAILGGAIAFGAVLWAVPVIGFGAALDPSPGEPGMLLLLPSALAGVVLAFAAGVWVGRRGQTRHADAVLANGQSRLALAQAQLRVAAERAEAERRRIALLLDCAAPGAALFDDARALLAWNRGFAALAEVPEAALHAGLPLAELVRLQPSGQARRLSRHGIEAGVAGAALRQRGDGSHVEDRWSPGAEGGMLLTCHAVEGPRQAAPLSATALAALCEEEIRTRLPRLQAAVAAGDAGAARMESHAIRGVAASFGLDQLAEALLMLETAARAGDVAAMAAGMPGLPQLAEEQLQRLSREAA